MNIDKWKKKPTKKELIDIIKNQEEVISELHEVHKHFLKLLDSKDNIIKEVREYIENNKQWYDKELGLVEIEGYKSNRIPIVYLYGLLEILDKADKGNNNE